MEAGERAELRGLMERLADGDRTAFGPAFRLLWPKLRAFAVRWMGPADGEDAAQAALVKIFARASEYDRERDAFPWALGITAWECRTLRRKRERRREQRGVPDLPGEAGEAALILRLSADAVLGTLSPIDAETILSLATGRRAAQGATFRKRLQRALARFRLAWRQHE